MAAIFPLESRAPKFSCEAKGPLVCKSQNGFFNSSAKQEKFIFSQDISMCNGQSESLFTLSFNPFAFLE